MGTAATGPVGAFAGLKRRSDWIRRRIATDDGLEVVRRHSRQCSAGESDNRVTPDGIRAAPFLREDQHKLQPGDCLVLVVRQRPAFLAKACSYADEVRCGSERADRPGRFSCRTCTSMSQMRSPIKPCDGTRASAGRLNHSPSRVCISMLIHVAHCRAAVHCRLRRDEWVQGLPCIDGRWR